MRVCKYLFFSFLLHASLLSAQEEVTTGLVSNPYLLNNKFTTNQHKVVLTLPFLDDFSYDSNNVDADLWQNSAVFVNRNYPISPPTIGVATFDGMNEKGFARDFTPLTYSEPSDTLVSKPIDLSAESIVYLMFFFQGGGIGDAPETQDRLVLEFLNDTVWVEKWSSDGQMMQDFKKQVIVIDSIQYLTESFQFRFRNYATISGNFDHWHIDYVKMDALSSIADTTELDDMTFVYSSPSFLSRYFEMPWTHFLNNEASELKDSIDIKLRNNDASINVDYQYNVFEDNNQIFHYPTIGVSRNVSVLDYDTIGNYLFSDPPIDIPSNVFVSFQSDSVVFLVQNIIGTAVSDNKENDTLYHSQNFYSHFAYDDGGAESAYGINVSGAKLAYEFKLNRPDTLRAVQMYFPHMLDSVNNLSFKLTVWDDIFGSGNILYQQEISPIHTADGKYHTYYLDSAFKLVGTFFVGWEQITDDLLNIGLDRNNEANNYMYYNVGGGWMTSSIPGSWMIRPILSMKNIVSSMSTIDFDLAVYPNPVSSELFIETGYPVSQISIYNTKGILVKNFLMTSNYSKINLNNLSSGIYFLELLIDNSRVYKKIIIR